MGRPIWARKPNITPSRVRDLFGKKAKVVQMGDGRYTISGSDRDFTSPRQAAPENRGPFQGTTRDQALPNHLIGVEGVLGRFGSQPRLNPQEYVVHPARVGGGFFAEPRTELSGLGYQTRRDIEAHDTRTQQQAQRFDQEIARAQGEAREDARLAGERRNALAGLIGAESTDATAQALGESARAQAVTAAGVEEARQGEVASTVGADLTGRKIEFLSDAADVRAGTIQAAREADAEAAFERWQAELEANIALRGQQTNLVAQILSNQNAQNLEQLRQTGQLDRLTRELSLQAAQLESDNENARLDRESEEAIALANIAQRDAASQRAADGRGQGSDRDKPDRPNRVARNDFMARVRELAFREDDDGELVPRDSIDVEDMVAFGQANGFNVAGIVNMINAGAPGLLARIRGGGGPVNRVFTADLYRALRRRGATHQQVERAFRRQGLALPVAGPQR